MSYDLFFKVREEAPAPDVNSLAEYFSGRKHYEVSKQQALYQNEATGVYFIFDLGATGEEEEQTGSPPIAFNLNYFRPHIFGLEAELEVRALVENFGFLVSDSQINGMGEGEYTTEGFLSGWNTGNEFGYRAFISQRPDQQHLTLPTTKIEGCWRWNFAHGQLQEQLGENVFVPRLLFLERNGAVSTGVVWPDGIPTTLPEADVVLIPRKTLLPKKFFRHPEDLVIASWTEVKPIMKSFPIKDGAVPYHLLDYSTPPETVISQLRAFMPTTEKFEVISSDKVLNAELDAKARAK